MLREWDAPTYHRVSQPQVSWGEAVLARLEAVRHPVDVAIDAGCGTGRLTAELAARLPAARVIGVDVSEKMLAEASLRPGLKAGATGAGATGVGAAVRGPRFVRADVSALPFAGVADLIFSTATFHWVLDHPRLFRGLWRALKPGGSLLAQCGGERNLAEFHARAERLMAQAPFASFYKGWKGPWEFASAERTAERLRDAGFVEIETSVQPAPVLIADGRAYEEFITCVILRLHLAPLPAGLANAFVRELTARAAKDDPPFRLDYWRLNMSAGRPV